ncbi:hypothetical protein H4S02_010647, partial [Coemansia sp. RSA 2611]
SGPGFTAIQPGSYFVEFYGEPAGSNCDREHAAFAEQTRMAGLVVNTRNSFKRLFNGVAIDLPDTGCLEQIASLPM